MPRPPFRLAPGTSVTCESDICTPRGLAPEPHPISASCQHPRRVDRPAPTVPAVRRVVCDRHSMPGARFLPHDEAPDCVHPMGVEE